MGNTQHLMELMEARNVDSTTKTYKFAYEEIRVLPGITLTSRGAVLVSPEDHSHDFAETVTRNAGQDVSLFRDREVANKHLLQEPEDT